MSKIILVNDCKFEIMVMKDLLNNLEYEVYASDEYGVLSKIKELSPDILICNLLMKETTGNLMIAKVKEVFPNIRCYISSNNDIKLESYKKNKVDGVIKTPTNIKELENILSFSNNDIRSSRNTRNIDKVDEVTDIIQTRNPRDLIKKIEEKTNKENKRNIDNITKKSTKGKASLDNEKVMKYCPYCGENIQGFDGKLAFCPYCGGSVK